MQKKAAQIGADAVIVVFLGGYYSLNDQWVNYDAEERTRNPRWGAQSGLDPLGEDLGTGSTPCRTLL